MTKHHAPVPTARGLCNRQSLCGSRHHPRSRPASGSRHLQGKTAPLRYRAAAGASCLAIAALAAASANQATAAHSRYAGTITLGYSFTDFDPQNGADSIDVNTFIGSGAVVYNIEGDWFAQANFAFASHSPDISGSPIDCGNLSLPSSGEATSATSVRK